MKQKTTRALAISAMLIALQIVLSKFLMVQLGPSLRLSIDSVPIVLAGLWFGPLVGGAVGALADILGTVLFPTAGAYFPPLTAAFVVIGVSAGLLRRLLAGERANIARAALLVCAGELLGSYLVKSVALSWLTGAPVGVLLASRALPVAAVAVVDTVLVYALHMLVGRRLFAAEKPAPVDAPIVAEGGAHEAGEADAPMTYEEALAYIHSVTWRGSKLGLDRTHELCARAGDPQRKLRFLHIAGTNGKGSTAAMLAAILSDAGYTVGLYTSPFITRFNERMQINGEQIGDEELAELTAWLKPLADGMANHPTEFEMITVLGFEYFLRHNCDVVVLEVGLGGELDSTNVIDVPELAVITNIGLDHTRELGPTIADVARAKAGIIKENGDVVIYGGNAEADAVLTAACDANGARLIRTVHDDIHNVVCSLDGLTMDFGERKGLHIALVGAYQAHNAAVVLTAVDALRRKGWHIPEEAVRSGLLRVAWPARFEVLTRAPLFLADGGHNPQGVQAAVDAIRAVLPGERIAFLLGVMADKDVAHMLEKIAPVGSAFFTVTPHNSRAMPANELAERLGALGCEAMACEDIGEGVRRAWDSAKENGGAAFALGSLYLLGDVRNEVALLAAERQEGPNDDVQE